MFRSHGSCVPLALLAMVTVFAVVPVNASAANPSVNVTAYSKTVSGNIGSATDGVSATVSLIRAGTLRDSVTSPATSGGTGDWSATLPLHAPGDPRDVVLVGYSAGGDPVSPQPNVGNPYPAFRPVQRARHELYTIVRLRARNPHLVRPGDLGRMSLSPFSTLVYVQPAGG